MIQIKHWFPFPYLVLQDIIWLKCTRNYQLRGDNSVMSYSSDKKLSGECNVL